MSSVIAVVVTHNPPDGMSARLAVILGEVDRVVMVDNGSDDASLMPHHEKIEIIRNRQNKGLAAALNQGIRHAFSQNADWVLLLDHDSAPEPGMVARMLAAYQVHPGKERIGLIAPEIKDENSAAQTRYLLPQGKFWFKRATLDTPTNDQALSVITSGSLIKASIFNDIGLRACSESRSGEAKTAIFENRNVSVHLSTCVAEAQKTLFAASRSRDYEYALMPEHFFIDYIDHDFCLRLKTHGYKILLVKDAVLRHRLGDKKNYGGIIASNHSPARRTTIFRNRIWIWKRYGATFPGFVMHDVLAAGYDVLRIVLIEKQKGQKLQAIIKGIRDGLGREAV